MQTTQTLQLGPHVHCDSLPNIAISPVQSNRAHLATLTHSSIQVQVMIADCLNVTDSVKHAWVNGIYVRNDSLPDDRSCGHQGLPRYQQLEGQTYLWYSKCDSCVRRLYRWKLTRSILCGHRVGQVYIHAGFNVRTITAHVAVGWRDSNIGHNPVSIHIAPCSK